MNSHTLRHNTLGFTLIELLIYITLVSGILITATSFAWGVINSRTKTFAVQEVEGNGRFIMDRLTQEVHQARKVAEPLSGQESKQLIVAMRDTQFDPTIVVVENGQLFLAEGGKPKVALSSSQVTVTKLQFINMSTADNKTLNIKIVLGLEHRNPDHRQEWQASDVFETTVEIRDDH